MVVDLSKKRMGFYASDIPQNGYFYEVREKYLKKGSKWVLVEAKSEKITVAEYARGCDEAVTKFLRGRREYNNSEWGRICCTFSNINPLKDKKTVSHYYTPLQWKNMHKR